MRFLVSLFGGVVVATALFLLMRYLVESGSAEPQDYVDGERVEFVRLKREDPPKTIERAIPPKPPPPEKPPPPQKLDVTQEDEPPPDPLDLDLPNLDFSIKGTGASVGTYGFNPNDPNAFAQDGRLTPLVQIAPNFPHKARLEGVSGFVELEVSVNPLGIVDNVRVLRSDPRGYGFEREAIRAAMRWKFKPRIIDGTPVAQKGVVPIEFPIEE